jgi:hypothetical protein
MKNRTTAVLFSVILSAVITTSAFAGEGSQIMFLRFHAVESADGTVLSSGSLDDPLSKKLEYEDPDSTGVIRSTVVHLDEADFIIRVSYDSAMEAVSFYRTVSADGKREIDKSNRISRTKIVFGREEDR